MDTIWDFIRECCTHSPAKENNIETYVESQ